MNRGLHYGLWVAQILLAVAFGVAGGIKATQAVADLAPNMPWVNDVPEALVRFIGVCEMLGAIGLVLPTALRIQPKLTPLAATGLTTVIVLAAGFHASRGETPGIAINVVLGSIAAFVAWGRWKAAPIA